MTTPIITLAQAPLLVQTYLLSVETTLRSETIQTYQKKLQVFIEWWARDRAAEPFTMILARGYHRWLKTRLARREISKRSLGLFLSVLRQWSAYLSAQGVVAEDPCAGMVGPGQAKGRTHSYLSVAEIKTLLAVFNHTDALDLRDYVLCYLMLKTAVRPIELARANIGDLEKRGMVDIFWVYRKGTDERTDWTELLPEVKSALNAYLATRPHAIPHDPLFVTHDRRGTRRLSVVEIRRRVVFALQRANLKRHSISSLSLRHTAAIQAIRHRAPMPAVQRLMRHESLRTTQVFQDQLRSVCRGAERYLKY